jgi:SAM-dependent methyltransferase
MNNPWLEIPPSDYENHMREVGQSQVLNELMKTYIQQYNPSNFALLGCSTGNGLEHIDPNTKNVFAIDINPEYLKITREKFEHKIHNLQVLNLDIQRCNLPFKNIDLFFAGLVLEYVEPEGALLKIIKTLANNGVLVIVIQKNKHTSFVTKTRYTSLGKLSGISSALDEDKLDAFIQSNNMLLVKKEEKALIENKSFIIFEYQLKVQK